MAAIRKISKLFLGTLLILSSSCSLLGNAGEGKVKEISFTLSKTELTVGDKCIINDINVSPETATNTNVNFIVENSSIATVSGYVVTALNPGTTKIIGYADDGGGASKSVNITVVPKKDVLVSSILLSLPRSNIFVDEEINASVLVNPANANDNSYVISANPSNNVQISGDKIKALKSGSVTLIATANDASKTVSNSVTLTIFDVEATGIVLNPSNTGIQIDEEVDLNATVVPENAKDKTLIYTTQSGNSNIISISSNGKVKGVSSGEDYAIATLASNPLISAKIKFVVSPIDPTSVSAISPKLSIYIDEEVQISATVYPTNASIKDLSYKTQSGTNNVLSVSNTGLVTGIAKGEEYVVVYCTYSPDVSASIKFTVLDSSNPLDPTGDDIFEEE